MQRFTLLCAGLGLAVAGCGGDQTWTKDASWQGDDSPPKTPPSTTVGGDESDTPTPTPAAPAQDTRAWPGVRHDLSMRPGTPRTPACGCVAVEVGMPGKQAFLWGGEVPTIGGDAVVVALSARGVDFPAEPDEGKRRASISAVGRAGRGVITELERLPTGRRAR